VLKGDNVLVKMMNLLQAIFINGSLWEKKFMYKIHHFGQHIILKMTHKRYIILGHKEIGFKDTPLNPMDKLHK